MTWRNWAAALLFFLLASIIELPLLTAGGDQENLIPLDSLPEAQRPGQSPPKRAIKNRKGKPVRSTSDKNAPESLASRIEKVKGLADDPSLKTLHEIEEKYSTSQTVQMKVKKTLTLSVLKKTREFSGQMAIKTGGKLRLELTGASKSVVAMDGKTIWVVDDPMDPSLGKVQVLISDNPKQLKSQALIAFLLGRGRITDEFKLIERLPEVGTSLAVYLLEPKSSDSDTKNLRLTVDERDLLITAVAFSDSLDNETRLVFTQTEFKVPLADKFFKFVVPEGADITRMN